MPDETDEKISELHRLAEIGKLSGGFIHDLANHITVMSLSLDQVEASLVRDREQIREHTAESARVRKNMKRFVESMKKHIRGRDINCYFSVKKKMDELVGLFKYKALKEKVSLTISAEKEIAGVRIYGSRLRFNQLFSNLISNAIDAFEDTGKLAESTAKLNKLTELIDEKRVEIKIQKKLESVLISVIDNGPGIDEKIKEKIFDPFFTTKSDGKGMGLGLTTVKEIIERDFSGKITFKCGVSKSKTGKSKAAKGSTFFVNIPIRPNRLTSSPPNPSKLS